jgi:hypothetical protein
MGIEEEALKITTWIQPIIALAVTGVIVLWFKELVSDLVASIRWKMKPGFEPGDECYLDGERSTIISIGYRETIFEIDNGRGKVWRYIDNKRIPVIRLEKIIEKTKN